MPKHRQDRRNEDQERLRRIAPMCARRAADATDDGIAGPRTSVLLRTRRHGGDSSFSSYSSFRMLLTPHVTEGSSERGATRISSRNVSDRWRGATLMRGGGIRPVVHECGPDSQVPASRDYGRCALCRARGTAPPNAPAKPARDACILGPFHEE